VADSGAPEKAKKVTNRTKKVGKASSVPYTPSLMHEVMTEELAANKKRELEAARVHLSPRGRPPMYTPELGDKICMLVVEGLSFNTISTFEGMPHRRTIINWLVTNEDFIHKYALARRHATEIMADEMLDIADDGHNDWMARHWGNQVEWLTNGEAIARSRIRIDTRKWIMAKLQPKKWGEKLDITTDGKALPAPLLGGVSLKSTIDDVKKLNPGD
jgi:hypothetical protein